MTTDTRRLNLTVAVVAATVIAVLVTVILTLRGNDSVLSPEQVAAQLAGSGSSTGPAASPAVRGQSTPADQQDPAVQLLDTVAATLAVTCDGTRIVRFGWTIKPGYRLDERDSTSTSEYLWIESDIHDDVSLKVTCSSDPLVDVWVED